MEMDTGFYDMEFQDLCRLCGGRHEIQGRASGII